MLCRWLNADGTYSLPAELSAWAMHPAVAASPDSTGLVVYTQLPSGTSNSTRLVCRTVNATSTGVEKSSTATRSPLSLAISPNPLTGSATISFYAPTASNVSVYITNINGQKIRTINVGMPAKVNTRLNWDGLDGYGRTVVSGVYFCTLSAGDGEVRKKMLVLR
jgi:flagellar hook assembly protein FlgD